MTYLAEKSQSYAEIRRMFGLQELVDIQMECRYYKDPSSAIAQQKDLRPFKRIQ